jgi:hypothetical protein
MMHHESDLYCPRCHACLPGVACGQGEGTCRCGIAPPPEPTYKSPDPRFNRLQSGERFRPRLVPHWSFQLVQVHPEVIEIFQQNEYLCQVRWVDGELVCPQGGLPRPHLELMFREACA